MTVQVEKPRKSHFLLFSILLLAGVFIVGAIIAFSSSFFQGPYTPLAWEIIGSEGDAEVSDASGHVWHVPNRGEQWLEGQKMRTGADGVINLQIEGRIRLRLKGNSVLINKECKAQAQKDVYKLLLKKGVLFGTTTKEFDRKVTKGRAVFFVITTPQYTVTPNGAIFRIYADETRQGSKVGVLRGSVDMTPVSLLPGLFPAKESVRVRGLEKAGMIGEQLESATRVTPEDWQRMKEAYELLEKSAAMEAEQINISKEAGSFFDDVVFDHGTFFTPKMGYAGREFFKDPDTGEVLLEVEYDVFPIGSFVGVYSKTRNFDASKYEGLSFDVRRRGEEGFPASFLMELKSKGNVVRRFSVHEFHKDWTPMQFDFHASRPTPISELAFVFTNERAGTYKKGMLQFRNMNLVPKKQKLQVVQAGPIPVQSAVVAPQAQEAILSSQPAVSQAPVIAPPPQREEPVRSDEDDLIPQTISIR